VAPALKASAPASYDSRHCPAWVPAVHDLLAPNLLDLAEAKGVVLRSNVAERVVRQGLVVPCIYCLK
jgi:hypothetical protein